MIIRKSVPVLAVTALTAGLMPATTVQAAPVVAAVAAVAANPLRAVEIDLGAARGVTASEATLVSGDVVGGQTWREGRNRTPGLGNLSAATPSLIPVDNTFSGYLSEFRAIDPPYAVGSHLTGTRSYDVFVYDLRTGALRNMKKLGSGSGWLAEATGLDGDWLVGWAEPDGPALGVAPFAASAADPSGPRDLGTLGGKNGRATGVSGQVAVRTSDRADATSGAFYARLDQPGSSLVDLGTLGGPDSQATAVDGSRVVGGADLASGAEHAFVRNIDAAPGPVTDLGTLGGPTSLASDVDGSVVVGTSSRADGSTASWYSDLTVGGGLHDLGTLAANQEAPAVDGRYVAGTRETANGRGGFVRDVTTGEDVLLQPLDGFVSTTAVDVDGDIVVGTSRTADGTSRATAWRLTREPAPTIGFASPRTGAVERAVTVDVPVVRSGDLRGSATQTYTVTGTKDGATAGRDFVAARGTVRFANGQARTTIPVRLLGDLKREPQEEVRLRLGNGEKSFLVIAASDQQPDVQVRTGRRGDWVGAKDQVRLSATVGQRRVFQVRVGQQAGSGKTSMPVTIRATTPRGMKVRWYLSGYRVGALGERAVSLMAPKSKSRAAVLTAKVTVERGSAFPARMNFKAVWTGDVRTSDKVEARLVRR